MDPAASNPFHLNVRSSSDSNNSKPPYDNSGLDSEMSHLSIDRLPEELLIIVFEYLDSVPPSIVNIRKEPSLDLTRSRTQTLKDISCVSKRWRRITLPLLFKYSRLRIDISWRNEWADCPLCGASRLCQASRSSSASREVEAYHVEMTKAFEKRSATAGRLVGPTQIRTNPSTTRENFESPDEVSTAHWAWRIYHVLQDFCAFIKANNLALCIRSFVLFSGRMLAGKLGRFPHQSASREWRYPAASAFWQQLLSLIDPDRIVILAPPTESACLTNAAIDTFGDWAFGDMDYHILELRQNRSESRSLTSPVEYAKLRPFPPQHPSFAESSLLHLRDWTYVSLNEGSFLKAYGTYEFFERGPPSLVYSIKQCLAPPYHLDKNGVPINSLPALRSFTYTAIFPFTNHADFTAMLPYLEEIDIQLAPDPQSKILDDKSRIGKADLADCWRELLAAYEDLSISMRTSPMFSTRFPKLKKFVCRDTQISGLKTELDEILTPLCLPVWIELVPGVFMRPPV